MRVPSPDPGYVEAIITDPTLETCFLLMDGVRMG